MGQIINGEQKLAQAEDLDAIPIRVVCESESLHLAIHRLLVEGRTQRPQCITRLINVLAQESNVPEALAPLLVSVEVLKVCVGLRSMVVRQLKDRTKELLDERRGCARQRPSARAISGRGWHRAERRPHAQQAAQHRSRRGSPPPPPY